MQLLRGVLVLSAAGIGLYLVLMKSGADPHGAAVVRDHAAVFATAIDAELECLAPACITIPGAFPRSPMWNHIPCDACKGLEQAGLLAFSDGKYHLLEAGEPYYSRRESRFCFGEVKVREIAESLPVHAMDGTRFVSLKYVPEIHSPAPFLFTPEARALGLPEPLPAKGGGAPWLGAEQIITFAFSDDGGVISVSPWSGYRYGKYAREREAGAWH
ncbi:hypothetical protein [Thauera sp.]